MTLMRETGRLDVTAIPRQLFNDLTIEGHQFTYDENDQEVVEVPHDVFVTVSENLARNRASDARSKAARRAEGKRRRKAVAAGRKKRP